MVTEQARKDVWEEMLDIARLVRYYEKLADRHRTQFYIARGTLVLSALIGTAVFLSQFKIFPQHIQEIILIIAGLALALATAWDIVANNARKAAVLHAISKECSLLEIEWRELWAEVNNHQSDDSAVREKNRRLARRLTKVTVWAGDADVRENRKLNEECESIAYKIMTEKYVT